METVQNQNLESQHADSTLEDKARAIGRKADAASARLQHTWEDATTTVKSRLGNTTQQVRYRLQEAGEKAKQRLVVAKTRTVEKSHDAKVQFEGQVRHHPIKSVAVAFGAGALLGVLLRRR